MCPENQEFLCVQKIKSFYVSRKSRCSMCPENQDVLCVQKIKSFYVSRKSRVSMCPENLIFCLYLVMNANVYYKQ